MSNAQLVNYWIKISGPILLMLSAGIAFMAWSAFQTAPAWAIITLGFAMILPIWVFIWPCDSGTNDEIKRNHVFVGIFEVVATALVYLFFGAMPAFGLACFWGFYDGAIINDWRHTKIRRSYEQEISILLWATVGTCLYPMADLAFRLHDIRTPAVIALNMVALVTIFAAYFTIPRDRVMRNWQRIVFGLVTGWIVSAAALEMYAVATNAGGDDQVETELTVAIVVILSGLAFTVAWILGRVNSAPRGR